MHLVVLKGLLFISLKSKKHLISHCKTPFSFVLVKIYLHPLLSYHQIMPQQRSQLLFGFQMSIHAFHLCCAWNIVHKPKRGISIQGRKWSKLERGMEIGVKPKFGKGQPFNPRSWFISCKCSQVKLKTFIHNLSLAICLRVIG